MSYHKLDFNRRPLPERSTRLPLTRRIRGVNCYLFELRYDAPRNGHRRQCRKRVWLPDSQAAEALERELRGEEPAELLSWGAAWERYRDAHEGKRAVSYMTHVQRDVSRLRDFLGDAPIEQTPLARFVDWLRHVEATVSATTAKMSRSHALHVAKWCRSQGLIEAIPFEHAPVPEAPKSKRGAASIEAWLSIHAVLPDTMRPLWRALGLTGARISGMAGLLESEVGETHCSIVTKFSKRISFPLLPPLRAAIEEAREWKRSHGCTSRFVFTTRMGTRWTASAWAQALGRVLAKHPELPKTTSHMLRHGFATLAAAAGYTPDMLAASLGHDSRRSAEAYIHPAQSWRDTVMTTVVGVLTEQAKPKALLPAPAQ